MLEWNCYLTRIHVHQTFICDSVQSSECNYKKALKSTHYPARTENRDPEDWWSVVPADRNRSAQACSPHTRRPCRRCRCSGRSPARGTGSPSPTCPGPSPRTTCRCSRTPETCRPWETVDNRESYRQMIPFLLLESWKEFHVFQVVQNCSAVAWDVFSIPSNEGWGIQFFFLVWSIICQGFIHLA